MLTVAGEEERKLYPFCRVQPMPVAEDGSDSAEAGIISHEAVGDFAERSAGGVPGLARIIQGDQFSGIKMGYGSICYTLRTGSYHLIHCSSTHQRGRLG